MYSVDVNGKLLFAAEGALLSQVLLENGEYVEHPCGGKGSCKKCIVRMDGQEVLSCQYRVHKNISVVLPEQSAIYSESGAAETGRITQNLCFVLDIGTTTLALALVSLDEKQIIQIVTRTNSQRVFSADVMTRIDYCRRNGVKPLTDTICSQVSTMIAEFDLPELETLYVAGNTTMLHLFFGVDCSAMGAAPYMPVFLESQCMPAECIGIRGVKSVRSLPGISAFVGADLVAGLHLVGMPKEGKYHILVDLGTNAEIILFSQESALCTAAAAGPCFEGANISCGMSATSGAICAYSKKGLQTIENATPKGICGTGLFDIISTFLEAGVIDETGYMEQEQIGITAYISISRADIRQFQLAKSAVCAAILTLMYRQNISFEDIDTLYLSGGFSGKINLDNAVRTGLFPAQLRPKCVAINNSSLLGTVKYACENGDLSLWTRTAKYVDLSSDPVFSELFVENMLF